MSVILAIVLQFTYQDGEIKIYHPIIPSLTSTVQTHICNGRSSEVSFDTDSQKPVKKIQIENKEVDDFYIQKINHTLKDYLIISVKMTRCDIINDLYTTRFQFKTYSSNGMSQNLINFDFYSRTLSEITIEKIVK